MARKRRPPAEAGPDPDDERVKFPFGESDSGSWELDASSADRLPRPPRRAPERLPGLPPDSEPHADASVAGLSDDDLGSPPAPRRRAEDADLDPLEPDSDPFGESDSGDVPDLGESEIDDLADSEVARAGDDLPDLAGVSGPLVIVDDEEPDASSRFQASILDDSGRLAGSVSHRAPRRGSKPGRLQPSQASWRAERLDSDEGPVPTVSSPLPRMAPPPLRPRRPWIGGAVALLLGAAGVAGVELRRRADLEVAQAALLAAQDEARAAREATAAAEQRAAEALARERADAARAREAALAAARDEAERSLAEAKAALAEERRRAERAANAVEVELARASRAARDDAERRLRELLDAAVADAVAAERAKADAELAMLRQSEEERRQRELNELREKLARGATTRAEEERLADELQEEREALLDRVEPGGGGGVSEGVDDWDQFFETPAASGDGSGVGALGGAAASDPHPIERAWSWLRENVHGSAGYKNLSHFSTGKGDFRKTRHELRIELEYSGWLIQNDIGSRGLRLVAEADVRVDDADFAAGVQDELDDEERRRPILTPGELYLGLVFDRVELRAGYQRFTWGTGDLFNPTDNLNPIDFSDLFDTRRIPVFAAALAVDLTYLSLELVSIPTFTPSRLPIRGTRFDLLREAPLPVLERELPEEDAEDAQWAAKATLRAGGWDVSLSGFTGWNDLPAAELALFSAAPPIPGILPVHDRIHVLGADFATTLGIVGAEGTLGRILGGIQLHGEAAHVWTEGQRAPDLLQYVVGFNYRWADLIAEHDVSLTLEYAGDHVTREVDPALDLPRIDRALRSAVLTRLSYAVDDDLTFELASALVLQGKENALLHPSVKWNVTDQIQFELAGDVFLGPEDTFFGQFRRDGRVIAVIRALF